jgi:hypothetical protein
MTKQQAIKEILSLPYGLLATLTGLNKYEELDRAVEQLIKNINIVDVSRAACWQEVWKLCEQ